MSMSSGSTTGEMQAENFNWASESATVKGEQGFKVHKKGARVLQGP